jgi:cytochrome c-type biogenesis protein CcmH
MNDWILWGSLMALALAALGLMVYPLRAHRVWMGVMIPVALGLLWLGYSALGSFDRWHAFVQKQKSYDDVQRMLQSAESTQALIDKLKLRLDKTPASAHGWYLVGKLYVHQKDMSRAKEAFEQAHQLSPDDDEITVYYAQSVWDLNHQQFDKPTRTLLRALLKKHPTQPDALAMLAMDAYQQRHYKAAINYWERLLSKVPPQSVEAKAIQKAIATANQQLKTP